MTMYAGSETIDVSQSSPFSFPNFISQGLVEPLDDLPGAKDYLADLTDSAKQVAVYDGKLMGLPYFSTVWVWNYYTDLMEKAKFEPFKTYDELLEQLRKAKKDKIAEYPIFWVAGVGLEQLPGTWYQMTWNRGGVFFDKQGNHQLGPGSIARETLKWWIQTFKEELADPESLKAQFTGSAKAFGAGKNIYRGPNHHYGLNVANDPAQSPNAGKIKVHGSPGDGKTIGDTHVYFLCTANRDKEWAWKLLQYLGGKTKDGQYSQAINLARDAMLGSGYNSVMKSTAVTEGWKPWGDPVEILADLGQGHLCGRGGAVDLQAVALPVVGPDQHRGIEGADRPDHGRCLLRQPDRRHQGGAEGLTACSCGSDTVPLPPGAAAGRAWRGDEHPHVAHAGAGARLSDLLRSVSVVPQGIAGGTAPRHLSFRRPRQLPADLQRPAVPAGAEEHADLHSVLGDGGDRARDRNRSADRPEDVWTSRITKFLILVPYAVPPIASGLIWSFIYSFEYGFLNRILFTTGLSNSAVNWAGDPATALFAVSVPYIWRTLPFAILLLHAALQGINQELYEAASVDGAGALQRFWHITLPLLRPIIVVILVLRTSFAFAVFDEVLAITQGGPGDATWVASWYSYKKGFSPPFDIGVGAASAYVLAIIIGLIAIAYVGLIYRRTQ